MKPNHFNELIEDIDKDIVDSFQIKDELSNEIFDFNGVDYKLKNDIRKKLLKVSDKFIEFIGVEFFIYDIVLTGSLANYNWSEYSDIDLHILIDFKETEYDLMILKEFFDAKKTIWNKSHSIKIKNYDVELYVQDTNEEHISTGVYSILNNDWVIKPKKTNQKIDKRKILEKGETFAREIDDLTDSSKNNTLNRVNRLLSKIKKFRQTGIKKGGEYSYENLTFKLLRRSGYIEKLFKLKTDLINKKLSVAQ